MENPSLEITIKGKDKSGIPVSPKNLELQDAKFLLDSIDDLLFPDKKAREPANVEFDEGSLRTVVFCSLLCISSFSKKLLLLEQGQPLNSFHKVFQETMAKLQEFVIKKEYEIYLKTSLQNAPTVKIDKTTKFFIRDPILADVELYVYGKLVNAGGTDKANIHLQTDQGVLVMDTTEDFISRQEKNFLYRYYEFHVSAKQNWHTGEIEPRSYKVIGMREFNPSYNEKELNLKIKKFTKWAAGFTSEEILGMMRGKE